MADTVITYKGGKSGEFINHVPMRSLTAEDYAALSNEQRAAVRESPLYDYASYRDAQKPADRAEPAAPKTEGTTGGG